VAACNKADAKGSDSAKTAAADSRPAGDTKPAAAAPKAATKIDKLGLTAELPELSSVGDGVSEGSVMIVGTAPVNIAAAKDDSPKTAEDAQKSYADFNPKNIKSEKLGDGWALTFENTGSLGTNYWLTVRRTIAGKDYLCDTSVSKEEQREAALAICKSLKK
jgi:hypothetical protein